MLAVYNNEIIPDDLPVIFLAGPTPRSASVESWRPRAVALLEESGFTGAVVIPEDRNKKPSGEEFDYPQQIAWERKALKRADVVVFWVPRDLKDMPAFTTNIEFGFVSERRQPFVLGFPENVPKMRYLAWVAQEQNAPMRHSLEETIETALGMASIQPISQRKFKLS